MQVVRAVNAQVDLPNEVNSLLDQLNAAVASLDGQKFNDMHEYHAMIRQVIDPLLFGLPLRSSVWELQLTGAKHAYSATCKLFKYTKSGVFDKRAKYEERGKFSNVTFSIASAFVGCTTFNECIRLSDRIELESRVASTQDWLLRTEGEIEKIKNILAEQVALLEVFTKEDA
jgi:hypothetical protein